MRVYSERVSTGALLQGGLLVGLWERQRSSERGLPGATETRTTTHLNEHVDVMFVIQSGEGITGEESAVSERWEGVGEFETNSEVQVNASIACSEKQ